MAIHDIKIQIHDQRPKNPWRIITDQNHRKENFSQNNKSAILDQPFWILHLGFDNFYFFFYKLVISDPKKPTKTIFQQKNFFTKNMHRKGLR